MLNQTNPICKVGERDVIYAQAQYVAILTYLLM